MKASLTIDSVDTNGKAVTSDKQVPTLTLTPSGKGLSINYDGDGELKMVAENSLVRLWGTSITDIDAMSVGDKLVVYAFETDNYVAAVAEYTYNP